ncbi:hypothetical protein D9757_008781 [Collybiopsis confluens]|uniref:UvrD-like helicase ATP-binding domain-containing protein n=1 Tax=Collybiopsis confluens TaxID=2823264 RepID=A0A8H5H653_9AGAR|nr:hypothetical protein D9757_008781 [Collybiopsis confluens]
MSSKISNDLFSSSRLTSLAAVDESLSKFEVAISINFHHPENLLAELLSHQPQALPLVFSCINEDAFIPLKTHVYGAFQSENKLLTDSMAFKVLVNLSHFFCFHPTATSIIKAQDHYRTVEGAAALLQLLSTMDFMQETPPLEEEVEDFGVRVRIRGKKQKKPSRARLSKAVDPKPFKNLDLQIPLDQTEADQIKNHLLRILESILDFYLLNLRDEEFSAAIKIASVSLSIVESETTQATASDSFEGGATVVEFTPAAFPKIQPMKSALYFDSVEGFGEWSIFISQKAEAEIRSRHRKDQHSFDIIVKKIKELSNGHFSPDNQKRLSGPSSEVPIFEAKMTADLRLIYQIDIVTSDDERDKQAIKVFGIYTHAHMDNRMWESIGHQLSRKGENYRERCAVRKPAQNAADGQTFVPALFPPLPEVQDEAGLYNWLSEEDDPSLFCLPLDSAQLKKQSRMDKYVVFSQPLLNTMLADLDATFPHLVSAREKQIIEHPYSCYVIGRSGTGKTTTLLFKMLLVERTHQMTGGDAPKPRQIFVTQSRILAKKVEQYYQTLGRSLTATSQTIAQLSEYRARVGNAIFDEDNDMIDADDVVDWSGELPPRFSELGDEHFPLFTTFNGLCSLLEADIKAASESSMSKKALKQSATLSAHLLSSERGSQFVTYEVFYRDYWPHFPQTLTSKLDPSLVFSEFIGVIKGSEETLETTKNFLERSAYQNMSARNQSTFADSREDLYELFNAYITKKKRFGDVDAADRAHKILKFFKTRAFAGQQVDHLYVDEVQDNLLIDSLVLRLLCHDENGLFWAGDTAQTIAAGSSFRFNSLKAFQWRLENKRRTESSKPQLGIEPKTFELLINYRSHSGITNCAHSIIELITLFWKDSIDRLAPERGVVAGLKPSFFVGWDEDAAGLDHFLFGDLGNRIEFGAQQCILVRNDAARERLQARLGENVGLIMTIYDSKGLEFNDASDVLLYDFFNDSPAKLTQWRLLLNALNDRSGISAPDFERNKQRYTSICTELKFLYVAITRARENVWIIDSSEKSEPMRMYWTEQEVIRNVEPGAGTPQLASSSPPEEWERQGHNLFDRKKWAQARLCFERAGQPEKMAVAEAYNLRQIAERISLDSKTARLERNAQFVKAAEAFAKCSKSAGPKRKRDFNRIAGKCYREGREFLLAAECFHAAREFNDAVRCYRKAERYDEAVEIVQNEKDKVDDSLAEDVIRVAKMLYFSQVQSLPSAADREKKLQQVGVLFDSVDDQLEYLEDRDMDVARAAVLVSHGRAREAADLHLASGRVLEAIDFFIQDSENADSARRAAESILDGFWRKLTFAVKPLEIKGDPLVQKILDLAQKIDYRPLDVNLRDEISMFRTILSNDHTTLGNLGRTFWIANNRPAALLCLDYYHGISSLFEDLTVYEMAEAQELFRTYLRLLIDVWANGRPTEQAGLLKLFGFQKLSDSHVRLTDGTYLRQKLGFADQDNTLETSEFIRRFKACISRHIRNRVFAQTSSCKGSKSFAPCLTFAVFQFCHRGTSCREAHLPLESLTASFYNARLRIHLQQIQIVQLLNPSDGYSSPQMVSLRRRVKMQSYSPRSDLALSFWLNRLYNALFPPSYVLGTSAYAQFQEIPEYSGATRTIRGWVRDFILGRHYHPSDTFLSDLTRLGTLAMVFDGLYALGTSLIYRGKWGLTSGPSFFNRKGGGTVIPELIGLITENPHSNHNYITASGLALSHIMKDEQVHIDIGLLCDLLDKFVRSYVLVCWVQGGHKHHNVMLPRSWLSEPISSENLQLKRLFLVLPVLSSVGELLFKIYSGRFAGHLLYENQTLASEEIPLRVRTIFISRICRAVCLLGYNVMDRNIRSRIWTELTLLRKYKKPETQFPQAYRFYVEANGWDDLAREVRRSTKGSPLDEMVNIVHKDNYTPHTLRDARTVVYENLEDLPKLLVGAMAPVGQTVARTGPVQILRNPRSVASSTSGSVQSQPNVTVIQGDSRPVDISANEEQANGADDPENNPEERIEDAARPTISFSIDGPLTDQPEIQEPTENEKRSAAVIQQAYRIYVSRKAKQPDQNTISRNKYFDTYMKLDIPAGRYRKMLLGPLPHILVFLELLYTGSYEAKAKTRKRTLLPLKSEEIDLVDKQLTDIINMMKKIKKWQTTLEPISKFHSGRDCLELRTLMREIQDVVQNEVIGLPVRILPQTKAEFDTGFKGIAQVPAPPKAVPTTSERPELNTEDV